MFSRNSFSLNTTPAQSEEGGGTPMMDAIDESFWQSHLWPNPELHFEAPLPPPVPIFSSSLDTTVNADHVAGGGFDSFGGFAFPVLTTTTTGGGSGGFDSFGGFSFPVLTTTTEAGGSSGGGAADIIAVVGQAAHPVNMVDLTNNREEGKKTGRKREEDDHLRGERERRKKMRTMFTSLHSMLPHIPDKADKSTIVDEAINLIKTLETSIQALEQKVISSRPTTALITYEPSSSTGSHLKAAGQTTRESFIADYSLCPNSANKMVSNSPNYEQEGPVMFQTWTSSNLVLNTLGKTEALIMACSRKKPQLLTDIVAVLGKHKVEVETVHVSTAGDQCSYMIHTRLENGVNNGEDVYKAAVSELMQLVVDSSVKNEAVA